MLLYGSMTLWNLRKITASTETATLQIAFVVDIINVQRRNLCGFTAVIIGLLFCSSFFRISISTPLIFHIFKRLDTAWALYVPNASDVSVNTFCRATELYFPPCKTLVPKYMLNSYIFDDFSTSRCCHVWNVSQEDFCDQPRHVLQFS